MYTVLYGTPKTFNRGWNVCIFDRCTTLGNNTRFCPKETKEGWLLLTAETEANGDSKRKNERGLPWFWACGGGIRIFCPAFGTLVGPVQNIFFSSSHTISLNVFPSLIKLGRQSCRVANFLICVSGLLLPYLLVKQRLSLSSYSIVLCKKEHSDKHEAHGGV